MASLSGRKDADGEVWRTFAILTTAANAMMSQLHDRMPVILEPEAWAYTILHSFSGSEGAEPGDSLVQDASGTLYGATTYGGPAKHGTVFTLTPPAPGQSNWTETTIAGLADAGAPSMVNTPLLLGPSGVIYAPAKRAVLTATAPSSVSRRRPSQVLSGPIRPCVRSTSPMELSRSAP